MAADTEGWMMTQAAGEGTGRDGSKGGLHIKETLLHESGDGQSMKARGNDFSLTRIKTVKANMITGLFCWPKP